MMTQKTLAAMWDQMRQRHGIALRLIEALPADRIHDHPIPNMRTPAELVVHLYGMVVREMTEGVVRGEIREVKEAGIVAGLRTRSDLLAFVHESYAAAAKAVASITDAQLQGTVKTPWGVNPPGWTMISAMQDEFFHHRGQLYVFARALGAEPPVMWDFEHNASEFQPKATQQA